LEHPHTKRKRWGKLKRLLCNFAHWILDKCEPIDVWQTKIKTKYGIYGVTEIEQNHDFSKMTIKYEIEKISLLA
jgi:hypothetical protein